MSRPTTARFGHLTKAAFWLALLTLTVLSLMPAAQLPSPVFLLWDKAQHALGFATLAWLALHAYPQRAAALPALLLLHGAAIEWAQWQTGWRHGEWTDLLADGVGILAGWALWHLRRPRSGAQHPLR